MRVYYEEAGFKIVLISGTVLLHGLYCVNGRYIAYYAYMCGRIWIACVLELLLLEIFFHIYIFLQVTSLCFCFSPSPSLSRPFFLSYSFFSSSLTLLPYSQLSPCISNRKSGFASLPK